MKIRYGYVSNSSSTSFVIDVKKDIEIKDFIKLIAMGMEIELRIWLKEYDYDGDLYKGENPFEVERALFEDFKNMFVLAKQHIPELENFEIVERYEDKIIKERRY